jgi:hypothetical protein
VVKAQVVVRVVNAALALAVAVAAVADEVVADEAELVVYVVYKASFPTRANESTRLLERLVRL